MGDTVCPEWLHVSRHFKRVLFIDSSFHVLDRMLENRVTPSLAASPTPSHIPLMTRPLPHPVISTVNIVIPSRIPSLFTTCQSVVCFLNVCYLLNTLPQSPQTAEEWVQVVPSDSAFTLSQSAPLAQHDSPVAPPVSPTFYQMPGIPQVSHYFSSLPRTAYNTLACWSVLTLTVFTRY